MHPPITTPTRFSRKRIGFIASLLLLLFLVWILWPNRNLARARALQQELTSADARNLTDAQRREKWQKLREVQKSLSPVQRRDLSSEMRKRRTAEISRYFRLTRAEQTKFLDEEIRRMERMRQRGGPGGANRPGGPGGGPQAGGPGSGGPGTFGAPGQGNGPPGSTPANRDERRRDRLDSTTPAERSLMSQFFRDLNARRSQLGLPSGRGGGF